MSPRSKDNILEDTLYINCNFYFSGQIILNLIIEPGMSYGISRNDRLPPSQTMPLCLFTALRHSDHKSGSVMAIVTER